MKKKLTALFAILLSFGVMACIFSACGDASPAAVTISKETASVYVGETVKLTAKVTDKDGETMDNEVTWTSSNTSVATVSKGTVTGVADGTATITVSVDDYDLSASCTVTVSTKKTMTISQTSATIDLDSGTTTLQLTATCSDGGTVTWTSSDESVATVDSNGLVTAVDADVKSRTVTITATRDEASASCAITVIKSSAPETYDIERGATNATVAQTAGTWFHFLKTSDGSTGSVDSATYSSDGTNASIVLTASDVSETNTDGGQTEFYLRYQYSTEAGLEYGFSCTLTCTVDGKVSIGSGGSTHVFTVTAGQTITISVSDLVISSSQPMNIKLMFAGDFTVTLDQIYFSTDLTEFTQSPDEVVSTDE